MRVHVKTPSRLHFGLIDLSGSLGRSYGALGLAVDGLGYEISVEKSRKLEVLGPEEDVECAEKVAEEVARLYDLPAMTKISISKSIPRHVGLGSTTQLTLAVATAITTLYGVETSAVELAERTGRGKNSGAGTYAFLNGGFIVDGGVRGSKFPPLIFRLDFPEKWRFIITTPKIKRGLDERTEEKLFKRITAPAGIAREICHLLIMKMLPSIVERDIENFGRGLTEVQGLVGKAFSPYQKGIFQSGTVFDAVSYMLEHGAYGAGQSSWGPTVYGLAKNDAHADRLRKGVKKFLRSKGHEAATRVVKPNNTGAKIKSKV